MIRINVCIAGLFLVSPIMGQAPIEDPTERIEKIIGTAETIGLKLTEPDTGEETRKLQSEILAEIDELLKQAEQPPPPMPASSPGGNGGPPMSQANPQPSPGGSGVGKATPRPGPAGGPIRPVPMPMGRGQGPTSVKPDKRGDPEIGSPIKGEPVVGLPGRLEDFGKGVWGHLPEKLRKDLDVYYRNKFMPEYGDLLREYYASVSRAGKRD